MSLLDFLPLNECELNRLLVNIRKIMTIELKCWLDVLRRVAAWIWIYYYVGWFWHRMPIHILVNTW